MHLQGKSALVTGGAHRVGRALVLGLARAGADVAIHYHGSEDDARETAREVEALGVRAPLLQADLSDAAAAEALPGRVAEALGGLDVLVNSASLFESADLADVSTEAWDRVMAVNLRAPFLLIREAARWLGAGGDRGSGAAAGDGAGEAAGDGAGDTAGGVVINIADLAGMQAWQRFGHHGVSKAGLIHLTKVAARSLAPRVRVNCVVPGTVLPPEDYTEEQVAASVGRTALKRIGSPDDVVEAMLFLIRSDFATGSVVVVDGGRLLT